MTKFQNKVKKYIILILAFASLLIFLFWPTASITEAINSSLVKNNALKDYKISSISLEILPEKPGEIKETYYIEQDEGISQCIELFNSIKVRKSLYNSSTYSNLNKESYIINCYDDKTLITGIVVMRKDVVILGKYYRISNYSKSKIQRFSEIALKYGKKSNY